MIVCVSTPNTVHCFVVDMHPSENSRYPGTVPYIRSRRLSPVVIGVEFLVAGSADRTEIRPDILMPQPLVTNVVYLQSPAVIYIPSTAHTSKAVDHHPGFPFLVPCRTPDVLFIKLCSHLLPSAASLSE